MQTITRQGVSDLIVVLYIKNEVVGWFLIDDRTSGFALPVVPLPLVQKSAFQS
jgi:hypothetical protein